MAILAMISHGQDARATSKCTTTPLRLAEVPSEPSSQSHDRIPLPAQGTGLTAQQLLFEIRTGAVIQEKMLKMQDDPDELLKTKGKFRTKNIDPDGCLKIKELR